MTAVANVLERYVQAELGKKSWHTISSLCTACLKACTSKQKVTKFFRGNNLEEVKKTIQSHLRKSTSLSNRLKYIFCNSASLHDFKTFNRGIIYWPHYSLHYNAAESIFNIKLTPHLLINAHLPWMFHYLI